MASLLRRVQASDQISTLPGGAGGRQVSTTPWQGNHSQGHSERRSAGPAYHFTCRECLQPRPAWETRIVILGLPTRPFQFASAKGDTQARKFKADACAAESAMRSAVRSPKIG